MSIVYHCLTCNAPLPSNRFHICPACRQIEAIGRSAKEAAAQRADAQQTHTSSYSSGCTHEEAASSDTTASIIVWAIYFIIDYNLNWFFAKLVWGWLKLMYIMFFSWWI
jgi:hypothetical protein